MGQNNSEQTLNLAVDFHKSGNFIEAENLYSLIIKETPNHFDALHLLGLVFYNTFRFKEAVEFISKAISINSNSRTAHSNLGNALLSLNRIDDAIASYNAALLLDPTYSDGYYNRGNAYQKSKRFVEALADYDKAILLNPDDAAYHGNRGAVLHELKNNEEAISSYDKAISLNLADAMSYSNRGVALKALGRNIDAISSLEMAILLKPDYAEAYINYASVLKDAARYEEALASCDRAIFLAPNNTAAHLNRGISLQALHRFEESLLSFDKAISLKADCAEAFYGRGETFKDLMLFAEALENFDKAIDINPHYAEAYSNKGYILCTIKRYKEALESVDQALTLKPSDASIYVSKGSILRKIGSHYEASLNYTDALRLNPDYPFLKGMLLHEKMMCSDWDQIQPLIDDITNGIVAGKPSAEPFGWQGTSHCSKSLQLCAETYNRQKWPNIQKIKFKKRLNSKLRINIGYLGSGFRDQATAHLLVGVIESHNKSAFKVHIIDNGWDDKSEIRKRLEHSCDEIIGIETMKDDEVCRYIQDSEIDILINLNGYYGEERTSIFEMRSAPIQVNYLGFPGTLGSECMDYIIADRLIILEKDKEFYSEKIAYMPNSYQPNDNKKIVSNYKFKRADFGLPEKSFVFCCFNNVYKITPETYKTWMNILNEVEGSVLWLLDSGVANMNLHKEAAFHGISPDRIIFAPRLSLAEHLARYKLANLFLDTLPCNAHTTASDALWSGLPVLTQYGQTFAGRVAASLLEAVGLPELITRTSESYEKLAIHLAKNSQAALDIKLKLEINRNKSPLFNTELYTRQLEHVYELMYKQYLKDEPMCDIYSFA